MAKDTAFLPGNYSDSLLTYTMITLPSSELYVAIKNKAWKKV